MVDMQVGIGLEASDDEVDEALESGFLVVARKRPVRGVGDRAVGPRVGVAEQILKAALADERVAFQVKEHVAGRWLRKAGKSEAWARPAAT